MNPERPHDNPPLVARATALISLAALASMFVAWVVVLLNISTRL